LFEQGFDAVNVVPVIVGDEDGGKLQALLLQGFLHWCGLAGIDHYCLVVAKLN